MTPSEDSMRALVGHRFPGGRYQIDHWENFLLTEATGIELLPDALAHPAHLFHVAINGVGTSIAELFRLAESGPDGLVAIDYYDWRIASPLREATPYALSGGITKFDRSTRTGSPTRDSFTYEIDLQSESGEPVATVEFRWHFWRLESTDRKS